MIQYPISKAELESLIEQESPGWLAKAKSRTSEFRAQGKYQEASPIWSDVKPVFMKIQACKCAFCERKLEAVDYGKVEQDVEHFRPKGRVRAWKAPDSLVTQGVTIADVPNLDKGYYLLPYHPFNYSSACKPCNSILKKDYFPIAGNYDLDGDDPASLKAEQALLIYPIGDFDTKAEELIRFFGVAPQAVCRNGYDRSRALLTIEFFKLDDAAARKNLFRGRAVMIMALYPQLCRQADGHDGPESKKIVDGFTSSNSEHTNCARSFQALFNADRTQATAVFDAACAFIASIS